jgi:hypothetical protein
MTKNTDKIRKGIRALTHKPYEIISGTVIAGSVDTAAYTMTVLPSDGSEAIEGVLLNVITNDENGIVLLPQDNSNVIIGSIDGPGEWSLLKASDLVKVSVILGSSKVTVTDGLIQFNDGSNGGLTITPELKTQLDKTNTLLNHLITVINGAPVDEPGSGAPSALQAALKAVIASDTLGDYSSIEDTTVKH